MHGERFILQAILKDNIRADLIAMAGRAERAPVGEPRKAYWSPTLDRVRGIHGGFPLPCLVASTKHQDLVATAVLSDGAALPVHLGCLHV